MNGDFQKAHDAIDVGTRVQVVERDHCHEGMVGDVKAIAKDGELKIVSNSGTRFWAMPEDVRVVQPS